MQSARLVIQHTLGTLTLAAALLVTNVSFATGRDNLHTGGMDRCGGTCQVAEFGAQAGGNAFTNGRLTTFVFTGDEASRPWDFEARSSGFSAQAPSLQEASARIRLAETKSSTLSLKIEGPDGTAYEGTCSLTTRAGTEELDMSGTVPESLSFEGEALKCELRSSGRLSVEAKKNDGNISRTTTSGGKVTISLR